MACRTATSPAIPGNSCNSCCRPNASRCWTVNWRWRREKRSVVAQRGRRDPAQFIGRWAESLDARLQLPDGQPLALHAEGRIDSEDWPRSSARFYLSLPQSDWAQWLPAGLTRNGRSPGQGRRRLLVRLARRQGATAGGTAAGAAVEGVVCRAQAGGNQRPGHEPVLRSRSCRAGRFGSATWRRISASSAGARVELLLRRDQQNNEPHWKLQADRVDLTPLVPAIEALAPLPDAAAEWVAA